MGILLFFPLFLDNTAMARLHIARLAGAVTAIGLGLWLIAGRRR